MGGKICLSCKGKKLLGVVNKLLKAKKFVDKTQQCFAFTPQANKVIGSNSGYLLKSLA